MKRLAIRPGRHTGEIRLTDKEKRQICGENKGDDMKKGIIFPESVLENLDLTKKEKKGRKEKELKEKREKVKKEEEKNKETLLRTKDKKLRQTVLKVVKWIRDFILDKKGEEILSTCGHCVKVFSAKYWRGEPSEKGDITTWCVLSIEELKECEGGECVLVYRDVFKGRSVTNMKIKIFENDAIDEVIVSLHPNLIAEFWDGIKKGKVWEYVNYSLDRARQGSIIIC